MKRIITAVLATVAIAGLSGCAAAKTDQAAAAPAAKATTAAASTPANDDQRVCRAVQADTEVGDARLDNAASNVAGGKPVAEQAARLTRIVEDIEGRVTQYPDATAKLKADVQALADHYAAAAKKLSKPTAYAAEVVDLRAAQVKLLKGCAAA